MADAGVRNLFTDPTAYDAWAEQWRRRLADDGTVTAQERMSVMRAANPAVIPRNHLVEEAISAAVNNSDFAPFESLLAVLARPYDDLPVDLGPVRRPAPARSGRAPDVLRYLEDRLAAGDGDGRARDIARQRVRQHHEGRASS